MNSFGGIIASLVMVLLFMLVIAVMGARESNLTLRCVENTHMSVELCRSVVTGDYTEGK